MKSVHILLGAGLISLLAGCASSPVAVAPVGPNPDGGPILAAGGELEVFSYQTEQSDNQNQGSRDPAWHQHTDYYLYDQQHRLIKHVHNCVGHYETAPRRVALAAGRYFIQAQANDYLWVKVPVTIEAGRITKVHLDDQWRQPGNASVKQLVCLPNGYPVGWRAQPAGF